LCLINCPRTKMSAHASTESDSSRKCHHYSDTLLALSDVGSSIASERAASGRPFCLPLVDGVLARSHLIQSQGCERPAVPRYYSFGSTLNGVAANPRKLAAMSPRRASCSKSAGEGAAFGPPFCL